MTVSQGKLRIQNDDVLSNLIHVHAIVDALSALNAGDRYLDCQPHTLSNLGLLARVLLEEGSSFRAFRSKGAAAQGRARRQ